MNAAMLRAGYDRSVLVSVSVSGVWVRSMASSWASSRSMILTMSLSY